MYLLLRQWKEVKGETEGGIQFKELEGVLLCSGYAACWLSVFLHGALTKRSFILLTSQAGYLYMEDILWSISNLTTTSSSKNSYHLYWYRYLAGTQKVYPDYNSTAFDAIYVADMALEYTEAEAAPRISSDTGTLQERFLSCTRVG